MRLSSTVSALHLTVGVNVRKRRIIYVLKDCSIRAFPNYDIGTRVVWYDFLLVVPNLGQTLEANVR